MMRITSFTADQKLVACFEALTPTHTSLMGVTQAKKRTCPAPDFHACCTHYMNNFRLFSISLLCDSYDKYIDAKFYFRRLFLLWLLHIVVNC